MKKILPIAAASILAAVSLTGCDPEAKGTSTSVRYEPGPATTPTKVDNSALCAQMQAQKDVNARLNADGYADNYGSEYDKLIAANC